MAHFNHPDQYITFEKEEIVVDSDEAREDVERVLRHGLAEIKAAPESLDPQSEWPEEQDFWNLANAFGRLFAYANTGIIYIGDLALGNPALQLSDVLDVVDNHPMPALSRGEHPMALFDASYARILSVSTYLKKAWTSKQCHSPAKT